jgi:hypothetical protein
MGVLTRGATALARIGATLRRDRLLHPAGVLFDATLTVHRGLPLRTGDHRAVVRFSKSTPTPAGWPDILGLAVRVYPEKGGGDTGDSTGESTGGLLDLALATTGRAVGLRHLLVPRRDVADAAFTSILPYRVGTGEDSGLRLVAAFPAGTGERPADSPPVFTLSLAPFTGSWEPVATLTVHGEAAGDVAFDVVANALPGFRPAGRLNRLRGPVYRASQRARRRSV